MNKLSRSINTISIIFSVFLAIVCGVFFGQVAFIQAAESTSKAIDPTKGVVETAKEAGISVDEKKGVTDIRVVLFRIVGIALTAIGTVLMAMIMYSGYLWWSAQGNDDQVRKAKATLRNAIIGMILVGMSYGIVSFFTKGIIESVEEQKVPTGLNTLPEPSGIFSNPRSFFQKQSENNPQYTGEINNPL